MAEPKNFKGFALPVKIVNDTNQMKGIIGEVFRELINAMARNDKELKYQLNFLDSLNITEINTNITNISSEDGKTVITGPLIEMYDDQSTPVLRLEMGFDGTDFVFTLYDENGDEVIDLDSNGNAVFGGTVKIGVTNPIEIEDNSGTGRIIFYEGTTIAAIMQSVAAVNDLSLATANGRQLTIASNEDLYLKTDNTSTGNIYIDNGNPTTGHIYIQPAQNLYIGTTAGWTGTFTDNTGKTVTVTKGIITGVA